MKKSAKYSLYLIAFVMRSVVIGQEAQKTFSVRQLVEIVKQYHPVGKQADLIIEKAKADLLIARGFFDPTIQNEASGKTFNGTDYYQYNRPSLAIPTWFGVELTAGLEYLSGNLTDPSDTRGESSYIGISIPLAKNLLMDKRRATLQSAKIFRTASLAEKRNMLNNLLLDALTNYWAWVREYQVYQIMEEVVSVNKKRLEMVKTAYRLGDRPAIDTTEGLAQLQQFEFLKSQAWLEFKNKGLELSLYLWTTNNTPFNLPEEIVPADELSTANVSEMLLPELEALLEIARKSHPELLIYNYKLGVLNIEKKLKFQELLPSVNFRYNRLGKGYDMLKTFNGSLFSNNFQYGIELAIPLRLSQGRGEYKRANLEIVETKLQQNQKLLQIENKVKSYFNELTTLQNQIVLQEKIWQNHLTLQRGEETRYFAGESSLFIINARENKTLEALQKLQELKSKFLITENKLKWATGSLIP